MDLQYTPEQNQLRESVERFVREEYDFTQRRKRVATELGYDDDCWRRYAEFGWLAIPFKEEDGGIGGDAADTGIVMEGIGRGLLLEPYLANVVLAGGVLDALGSSAQKAEWLQPMMVGDHKLALAYAEPEARYETAFCSTTARRDGLGYLIDGHKSLVYGGSTADVYVVIVRSGGTVDAREGLTALVVDAGSAGLAIKSYALHDGQRAADLTFDGVRANEMHRLGEEGEAGPVLDLVVDKAIAAVASEAVGAMTILVNMTLEYLKTRQQFGRPIGANQALQHRMVDMYIALDEARSMALYGTLMLTETDPAVRRKALSATKIEIDRTARLVGQEAVQLHGAMGVTEELAVGHYFKRLSMIGVSFGDMGWHLLRYGVN